MTVEIISGSFHR